jgi:heme/copper-type cytochrome/quinol oxidase subunit 3
MKGRRKWLALLTILLALAFVGYRVVDWPIF